MKYVGGLRAVNAARRAMRLDAGVRRSRALRTNGAPWLPAVGTLCVALVMATAAVVDPRAVAQTAAPTQPPAMTRSGAVAQPANVAKSAAVDVYGQIDDPGLQARFEAITKQLRCLVCQNESIADSNVELASDLRRQVREMLIAGKSDSAIFDFMTDRYGDFVRFNPPLKAKTLLIWGAPFFMLLLGAGIVFRVTVTRSRMPLDDEPLPGSP